MVTTSARAASGTLLTDHRVNPSREARPRCGRLDPAALRLEDRQSAGLVERHVEMHAVSLTSPADARRRNADSPTPGRGDHGDTAPAGVGESCVRSTSLGILSIAMLLSDFLHERGAVVSTWAMAHQRAWRPGRPGAGSNTQQRQKCAGARRGYGCAAAPPPGIPVLSLFDEPESGVLRRADEPAAELCRAVRTAVDERAPSRRPGTRVALLTRFAVSVALCLPPVQSRASYALP